jgi:Flp pilus assembly protein TadB
MQNGQSGAAEKARSAILVALGAVLAAVPLALWIAWSQEVFFGVLAVGGLCVALCLVLVDRGVPRAAKRSHSDAVGERAELSE